ncbi:helix-turn-helix domain-containing protein [Anaeromyxobacter terrae]|uniref:helix-turn-helix domain-containing protein n=1 Tax=Anaeromyxobacter terrae TaxID=2925406 RepID=UPI001F57EB14|nr:helix-turn-helix transcriptional regulator [Anaeromyxobacter sp. SG22]
MRTREGGGGGGDSDGMALRPPWRLSATRLEIDGEELVLLEWTTAFSSSASPLSRAEAEVARLVLGGASNAAIAAGRGRDLGTVAKQVSSAFRKLGVRSRSELYAKLASGGAPRGTAAP